MSQPFDSIRIGAVTLANRLAMAPMKTGYGTTSGQVTDQLTAYFRRRAEGGVGLIISEPLYILKRGSEHPRQLGIDADDKLDGLRQLVVTCHDAGAKVFAHINHAGRAANPAVSGEVPEAPSRVPCARTGCEPEALTKTRIAEIVRAFAAAAGRARATGFDGVELQFGLGYLVAQFLSGTANTRTDQYGGDEERRQLFALEIMAAVRDAVGECFPVGVRISGSEKAAQGLELEDAVALARRLEAWGADLIHVATGSTCDSVPWYFQHMSLPAGVNETLAASVRKEVTIPVMAAGRLGDPPRIREVLAQDMVDLVALGRPLLADPDLPVKMRAGRDHEVLLCGHCLQACFAHVVAGMGIGCNINPTVGQEQDTIMPAALPKHVVVVGGGPAGMQAALTAHRRGHRVTLFEKNRLGGQFTLASLAPGKERMADPLRSMVALLERSGIELHLGEEATRVTLEAVEPDVVIVATGSHPAIPDIAGLHDPVTGEEILVGTRQAGERVLILGGGMVGLEVAEFVARRGRSVAVVEMLEEVAGDMDPISRKLLLKRLAGLPVGLHTQTKVARIEDGAVFVEHAGTSRELGRFDTVVVTAGNRPFDPVSAELKEAGLTVYTVGDAAQPGNVYAAVQSGHRAGLTV